MYKYLLCYVLAGDTEDSPLRFIRRDVYQDTPLESASEVDELSRDIAAEEKALHINITGMMYLGETDE